MLTDVQNPFLGTPLVPLKCSRAAGGKGASARFIGQYKHFRHTPSKGIVLCLRCTELHRAALQFFASRLSALHYAVLHVTLLRCTRCTALHRAALRRVAVFCGLVLYTAASPASPAGWHAGLWSLLSMRARRSNFMVSRSARHRPVQTTGQDINYMYHIIIPVFAK